MKVVRWALVVVILFNLALLTVVAPLQGTLVRYEVSRQHRELRQLTLENRRLQHDLAVARRPDRVFARAAEFGLDLRVVECSPGAPVDETALGKKLGINAPRR